YDAGLSGPRDRVRTRREPLNDLLGDAAANDQRHRVVLVGEQLDPSPVKTLSVRQLVQGPTENLRRLEAPSESARHRIKDRQVFGLLGELAGAPVHPGLEDARVSGQLAFEADLGAVAGPRNANERQVKDSARDPAEDPDHDDTVIEDRE